MFSWLRWTNDEHERVSSSDVHENSNSTKRNYNSKNSHNKNREEMERERRKAQELLMQVRQKEEESRAKFILELKHSVQNLLAEHYLNGSNVDHIETGENVKDSENKKKTSSIIIRDSPSRKSNLKKRIGREQESN